MTIERRTATLDTATAEMRANDDDSAAALRFFGHAAVFDQRALIGGKRWGFVESIRSGAFAGVLQDDVRFLHNHDPNILFARTTNGTLHLREDQTGLVSEAEWIDTTQSRDVAALVQRRDVTQMSFAFTVKTDEWTTLSDDDPEFPGMEARTILEFERLYDVSTVTYPAFVGTDAGMRDVSEAEVRGILERARRPEPTVDTDAILRELDLRQAELNLRRRIS